MRPARGTCGWSLRVEELGWPVFGEGSTFRSPGSEPSLEHFAHFHDLTAIVTQDGSF